MKSVSKKKDWLASPKKPSKGCDQTHKSLLGSFVQSLGPQSSNRPWVLKRIAHLISAVGSDTLPPDPTVDKTDPRSVPYVDLDPLVFDGISFPHLLEIFLQVACGKDFPNLQDASLQREIGSFVLFERFLGLIASVPRDEQIIRPSWVKSVPAEPVEKSILRLSMIAPQLCVTPILIPRVLPFDFACKVISRKFQAGHRTIFIQNRPGPIFPWSSTLRRAFKLKGTWYSDVVTLPGYHGLCSILGHPNPMEILTGKPYGEIAYGVAEGSVSVASYAILEDELCP